MKRLPTQHRFPGGFRVTIVEAPRPSARLSLDDEADYHTIDCESALITLWDQLTPRQKWAALMHELLHALADAQNCVEKQK